MNEINVYKKIGNDIVLRSVIVDYIDYTYVFKMNENNTFELKVTPFSVNSGANEDFFKEMFQDQFNIKDNLYFFELENDKKQVGVVTEIEQVYDERSEFTFKGIGLEGFLDNTINNPVNNIYSITDSVSGAIQQIITDYTTGVKAVNGGIDTNKVQNTTNPILEVEEVTANTINSTYSFKLATPLEQINEIITITKIKGMYYKIYGTIEEGKIKYHLKQGINKSDNIKFDNLYRGNLKDLKIKTTNTEEYNAYTVGNNREGAIRTFVNASDNTKQDLFFRELFVSANDEDGNLNTKGIEAIEGTKTNDEISGTLANSEKYDLFVGDVVEVTAQLKLNEFFYEREFKAPIVEIGYSYKGQKIEKDIKVGDLIPIYNNKTKQENKNNKKISRR